MRFTIISIKPGQQPPQNGYDFYAPGGTIGRGTDNNLVLPDNDRAISRLQVIVHVDAQGRCRITNRGSITRVVLNDIPIERGRQVELQPGDVLGIGDYRIKVSSLMPDNQPVASVPEQSPQVVPLMAPEAINIPDNPVPETTNIPAEIWDNLMKEYAPAEPAGTAPAVPPHVAADDPFLQPAAPERNAEDPLAVFHNSDPQLEHTSVNPDTLFTNEALFKQESIFNDVTPSTLTASDENPSLLSKNGSGDELDPLALFGASPASHTSAPAQSDLLGLMGGAPLTHPDEMVSPVAKSAPQNAAFTAGPNAVPPPVNDINLQPAAYPGSIIASPGENASPAAIFTAMPKSVVPPQPVEQNRGQPTASPGDYNGITLPTPQAVAHNSNTPLPKGRLRIDPIQNVTPPASASVPESGQSSQGETLQGPLLDALLEGLGLSEIQPVPHFDSKNMRQLGHILSLFSQGTVALLSSRSILKRGVKADMTMVLDDANNPFKLLPTGKTVLIQMFGMPMPGFMAPTKSVRDALIDLQAHQLGMIAGIRAIIAAMLQSFNPEQLEEQAQQDGVISRIALPGRRKAALWDYFVRRYSKTAGEIEDDFHTLFGEAFLHAYEMEVNQYKDSQSGTEK